MKKSTLFLLGLVTLVLSACSGSDTYRGDWKATNENGDHIQIAFGENDFSITENGEAKKFEYSQNSVNISNGVETYGIKVGDGRAFQIHFPIGNDESKGVILDANGQPLYIISRSEYLGYKDVYGM